MPENASGVRPPLVSSPTNTAGCYHDARTSQSYRGCSGVVKPKQCQAATVAGRVTPAGVVVAEVKEQTQLLIKPSSVHTRAQGGGIGREPKHRVVQRYVWRLKFQTGDRVIVCVRKDGHSTWKHGFVANLDDMPPISTGDGQYAYPVVYERSPRALRFFKSSQGTILYDVVLSTGADLDIYGSD